MDTVYQLPATSCPAPQVRSTLYEILADPPTPTVYTAILSGTAAGAQSLVTRLNRNSRRSELLAEYGGGCIARARGLSLDVSSGLTLAIEAGHAVIGGPVGPEDDTTLALTDSQTNRVWLSQGGTFNKVTGASATPLAPPDSASPWWYAGLAYCSGGAITGIDGSGVMFLRGGMPFRITGDTTAPDDEPDSSLAFYTINKGGVDADLYLWDGSEHRLMDQDPAALIATQADFQFELDELGRKFRRLLLLLASGPLGASVLDPELQPDFRQALAEA